MFPTLVEIDISHFGTALNLVIILLWPSNDQTPAPYLVLELRILVHNSCILGDRASFNYDLGHQTQRARSRDGDRETSPHGDGGREGDLRRL